MTTLAAPTQASRDDVLAQLEVAREASDYVVLVDVSGSMLQDDRYGKVRSALSGMMDALTPADHVALITFAEDAEVAYQGTDKRAALAALPQRPTGKKTDIGAGIEAGLKQLGRSGAKASGVLTLITDGTIDTEDDSPYATADADGWAELARSAQALTQDRPLAAYAIALGNETDAGLLSKVFPEARNVPGDEVGPYLGRIDAELLNFKAAEKLRADANATVAAEWSGLDAGNLVTTGSSSPTLTLTSHLTSAPVEVRDLRVLVADTPAEVTGFPEAVTLGPGESQQFPVALSVAEAGAGGSLVVRGTVDSAWHEAASGFGVELAPRLEASEVTLEPAPAEEPAPSTGTLLPILLGAAAVVAVLALLALLLRKRPRMHGTFAITRQGEIVREFMLDAPKLDLTHVAGGAAPELAGTITRAKVNGAEGVKVAAKVGKQKVRTVLADGGSVDVGELTLHWTSQRSRTLGMINDGL